MLNAESLRNTRGFSLIELMIAMTLGMLVITAVLNIYLSTLSSSTDTVGSAKLNHDLGTVALVITNDLRRAGYWGGAVSGSDPENNPFMDATTNVQIPSSDCIVYTYDADGDGALDDDEYYGFRLNNGTIQLKQTGATTANCNDGEWTNVLESNEINVTGLIFSFVTSADIENLTATSKCMNFTANTSANADCASSGLAAAVGDSFTETRQVLFEITATLDDDANVTKFIRNSVKLRNDRIFTQS
jgi:type IV pilus assembly protein PilW